VSYVRNDNKLFSVWFVQPYKNKQAVRSALYGIAKRCVCIDYVLDVLLFIYLKSLAYIVKRKTVVESERTLPLHRKSLPKIQKYFKVAVLHPLIKNNKLCFSMIVPQGH
jgi:hypothetical protein